MNYGFVGYTWSAWRVHGVYRFILAGNYNGFVVDMDFLCSVSEASWFISARNYNDFAAVKCVMVRFIKELQWLPGPNISFIWSAHCSGFLLG